MALELIDGAPIDGKVDVYSLGVMRFELIAQRLPFESDQPRAIMMMHLHKEPPLLREIVPSAPAEIAALCRQMMEKDPAQRPTIDEALARLEELERRFSEGPQGATRGR